MWQLIFTVYNPVLGTKEKVVYENEKRWKVLLYEFFRTDGGVFGHYKYTVTSTEEDIKNKPELLVMAQNEADTIVRQRIQEKIREKKTEIEELEKELAAIGV